MDPDFISEIIYESNLDFLLDISHAYASSKNLGIDFETYLYKLPLDRIYEIHINGWIETEDDIMSHTIINDLEYGRDQDRLGCGIPLISPNRISERAKEEIINQTKRLREIIKAASDLNW